jgi:hypothetical protein
MDSLALDHRTADAPLPGRMVRTDLARNQRSRRTNNPLYGLNLKTSRGRRIADLVRAYLKAVGNPVDVGRQTQVIAAAELQALAEDARAAALREPAIADLEQLVRLQGLADRALRRLGIKAETARQQPSLQEHLARRAAEAADDTSEGPA